MYHLCVYRVQSQKVDSGLSLSRRLCRNTRTSTQCFYDLIQFSVNGFVGIRYPRSTYFGSFHRDALRTYLRKRHVDTRCPMTLVTGRRNREYASCGKLQNTLLS